MTPSLTGPILGFLAVVALIPLVLWLIKRSPLGQAALGHAAGGGAMRVVGALALAPGQRLVTVEVGQGEDRRWLVLGVTAGQIQTLHSLPPQADAPAPAQSARGPFAQLLARQQSAGDGHAR